MKVKFNNRNLPIIKYGLVQYYDGNKILLWDAVKYLPYLKLDMVVSDNKETLENTITYLKECYDYSNNILEIEEIQETTITLGC